VEASELAAVADNYWTALQARLEKDRESKVLKEKENELKAVLLAEMQHQKLTSIGGQRVRISMDTVPEYVPTVQDWEVFKAYVFETKDLSLLERRVNKASIKERWEADKEVPGVIHFPVFKLHTSEVK
jgi:hypothetical protein